MPFHFSPTFNHGTTNTIAEFFFPFGLKFLTISLVVMFAKQYGKIASRVFKTQSFPDRSSSSFKSSSSILQIVFIFMRFPDRFFRSSSDLHAFSKSILQIVFRSFFFFLRIWFFSSSNHLHLHAFSRSVLQIIFRSSCVFQIGSSDHLRSSDTSIELESKKLEFHVDKLLHLSTRTRVLESFFLSLNSSFTDSRCQFPKQFQNLAN